MEGSNHILVVDDDPRSSESLSARLEPLGYSITRAVDGLEALERFNQGSFDLMLVDVVMPRMGGLELCRLIKGGSEAFVPLVFMTHQNESVAKIEGLRLGADDYLDKNIGTDELHARLTSLLRLKQQHDRLLKRQHDLEALSATDELTGLLNHRAMLERLGEEYLRAERYSTSLAVLMLDADHFKAINDTHGHLFGDKVLAHLGAILRTSVREVDICARYGGDEFMAILPNTPLCRRFDRGRADLEHRQTSKSAFSPSNAAVDHLGGGGILPPQVGQRPRRLDPTRRSSAVPSQEKRPQLRRLAASNQ